MNNNKNNSHKKKYEPDSVMILDEYSFPSESKPAEGDGAPSSDADGADRELHRGKHISDSSNTKGEKHSSRRRSKKSKFDFKALSLPLILTVCSVAVLVIVIAVTWISNETIVSDNDINTAQTLDSGETGAENTVQNEKDAEDDKDLLTVEEGDMNPGIEIPPSSIRDENGNSLIEVRKNNDGSVSGAVYRTYEDGKLSIEKEYSSSATLVSITEYVQGGKRVYAPVLDEKGSFNGYSAEEYDENGVLFKKSVFSYVGALSEYYLYLYNQDGTLQREDKYSSYDTIINYTVYKYDANGNNTERLQYDQNDVLGYRDELIYDSENRVVKEENYNGDILKTYTEYFYDENGEVESHSYLLVDEYEMRYKEIK